MKSEVSQLHVIWSLVCSARPSTSFKLHAPLLHVDHKSDYFIIAIFRLVDLLVFNALTGGSAAGEKSEW